MKSCFRQPGTVHAAFGYYRASSVFVPDFMQRKVAVPTLCVAGKEDPSVSPSPTSLGRSNCSSLLSPARPRRVRASVAASPRPC